MELLWTTGGLLTAVVSIHRWKVRDLTAVIKATGYNGRQKDAAEMGPTEAKLIKRWTKDENKEI